MANIAPGRASAQKILARALRLSGPPTAADFHRDRPSFDDSFDEQFKDDAIELDGFIALIPSAVFREHLETVSTGIAFGYELARRAGYGRSYRTAVHKASRIGFDVVSAWMRDEQAIDADLHARVVELAAAIDEFEEQYRMEHDEV